MAGFSYVSAMAQKILGLPDVSRVTEQKHGPGSNRHLPRKSNPQKNVIVYQNRDALSGYLPMWILSHICVQKNLSPFHGTMGFLDEEMLVMLALALASSALYNYIAACLYSNPKQAKIMQPQKK